MNETDFTIYIVDDDENVRSAITKAVETTMSSDVVALDSAEAFLAAYEGKPAVLVCEIRMPGMSGLELQNHLREREVFIPVVVTTAFPKVRFVVESIKNGAITVLEKPFSVDAIWLALREAITHYLSAYERHAAKLDATKRFASLTPGELAVLRLVMEGQPNKSMAKELGVSTRAIEARRRRILAKMNVGSVIELVGKVLLTEPFKKELQAQSVSGFGASSFK